MTKKKGFKTFDSADARRGRLHHRRTPSKFGPFAGK